MNFNFLKLAFIFSIHFLLAGAALADVNKCTTKAGKIEYRDGPCEGSGTSVTVVKKHENAKELSPPSGSSNGINPQVSAPAPSAPRTAATIPAPSAPASSVIKSDQRPKYPKQLNNRPPDGLK